jgi:hypothetical protein
MVVDVVGVAVGFGAEAVVTGSCAEPEGLTDEDWARTNPEEHEMAAISTKAGGRRLLNLHIFPPHEGIEATTLLHRLLKLEHHIVQHRQACLLCGCKTD